MPYLTFANQRAALDYSRAAFLRHTGGGNRETKFMWRLLELDDAWALEIPDESSKVETRHFLPTEDRARLLTAVSRRNGST